MSLSNHISICLNFWSINQVIQWLCIFLSCKVIYALWAIVGQLNAFIPCIEYQALFFFVISFLMLNAQQFWHIVSHSEFKLLNVNQFLEVIVCDDCFCSISSGLFMTFKYVTKKQRPHPTITNIFQVSVISFRLFNSIQFRK